MNLWFHRNTNAPGHPCNNNMSKESRKITRKTTKLLKKHLGLRINDNATFSEDDHFHTLIHAAMQHVSLEESSAQLNILKKAPSPDATQYHFKKKGVKTLEHELDSLLQENVATLKKRRTIHKTKDVAIDFHLVPWYGESNAWTVGGKHKQGTSYFVQFATLEIMEGGERLCIKAIPVTQFKSKEQAVEELLSFASKIGIRICRLYFDRAFPTTPVIKVLERFDVNWIAAISKNEKVKDIIEDAHLNKGFVREYKMGPKNDKVSFNLVLIKSKNYDNLDAKVIEKYVAFATNLSVDEKSRKDIAEFYRKRWGIETGYRVKREFRIRTSTRVYSMKILFFFVSVVMYNLWVILNFDALRTNPEVKRPSMTTDRMKFYYLIELFCSRTIDESEKCTPLHRKWVEEGVIQAKMTIF